MRGAMSNMWMRTHRVPNPVTDPVVAITCLLHGSAAAAAAQEGGPPTAGSGGDLDEGLADLGDGERLCLPSCLNVAGS